MSEEKENEKDNDTGKFLKNSPLNLYKFYFIIALIFIGLYFFTSRSTSKEIEWKKFEQGMLLTNDVSRIVVVNNELVEVYLKPESLTKDEYKEVAQTSFGKPNEGPHYFFTIGSVEYFQEQLDQAQSQIPIEDRISPRFEKRKNWGLDALAWLIPIAIFVAIWIFLINRISKGGMGGGAGGGGGIFSVGKSKALLFEKGSKTNVTFNDVAGLDEAKVEVMEIVDLLKNPGKYTALGAKIPKGVLLTGPPGTGKTLMAKAMAGEANVPFYSISGSDFVEMFVGVGAARVRDLFKQAREKAPCIIFIDEIEAIGRARGKNMMQSNDERENTLNQLLVEMDGFNSEKAVIILAATNRPDLLDSALLRPGRFDRQILIDKPDLIGREQIFKVHLRKIKLSKDVEEKKLAAMTPGFAGAEIANICNEAALIAARKNKSEVELIDFNDAIDRVIGGLEKKNKIISNEEKKIVAYHEAGHAICGWFLKYAHPLVKVSIVPRGLAALGYAQYLPKEQYLYTSDQLIDSICMTLGGRAAEEIVFGQISTGAQNDLERVTKLVYSMITQYGMNPNIGHFSYIDTTGEYTYKQLYSDETARMIDNEARKLVANSYERTLKLLRGKRKEMELIAQELLDKEIIYVADFERLIGKRKTTDTLEPVPVN
ncbi:MAG: ATP-dependent metallopeptidase FtsH/Yme1/Tma family protein [Bacteroidetes bacterium]|nr:ATP-dependent metallopeptidase FtsH/Yme1/Tma family protein [Bacteroidota bacterium]HET6244589.1 ATP-dependent zinc metalloprotease FtsH [Bacteroidia bacterium]